MKVAILTSGGDSPGMNAAIVSLKKYASKFKIELMAVLGGYQGLIDNEIVPIDNIDLTGSEINGGSKIFVSRSTQFMEKKYFNQAVENLKKLNIDYLIVIGGNGSLTGSINLEKVGINTIGIPASIDNDLAFDYSLGFDSAINAGVSAVDAIATTVKSIRVGVIVELMGRNCVDISTAVSKACFADLVIEKKISASDVLKKVKKLIASGQTSPIIIMKEHTCDGEDVAMLIEKELGIRMKYERLGYIQRGGKPSAFDRAYGHTLGKCAIECVGQEIHGITIGLVAGELVKMDTAKAIRPRSVQLSVYKN